MKNIVIVDYKMGNIGSVAKKIKKIGFNPEVTGDKDKILNADKLIIPGVGHFGTGVRNLKEFGLWDPLNEAVLKEKIPILGICLGMQLMAGFGEEGEVEGLKWFDAKIVKFDMPDVYKYKIPHTGWNTLDRTSDSIIYEGISEKAEFYFVHSYYLDCYKENEIASFTNYSYKFVSSVQKENIFGVQFHPEKSHDSGEKLLMNFLNL